MWLNHSVKSEVDPVLWSSLPVAVSQDEWVKAQTVDHTLSVLWAQMLPSDQIVDAAQGYFAQDNLLMHK